MNPWLIMLIAVILGGLAGETLRVMGLGEGYLPATAGIVIGTILGLIFGRMKNE